MWNDDGARRPRSLLSVGVAAWRTYGGRYPGHLYRGTPGQGGDGRDAKQDRSQRRARARADHTHRLVSRGARQKPGLSLLACPADGASDVLNKRRDVENGIRALLREAGLKVGTPSRKDFPGRVRELAADDLVLSSLSESLLAVVDVMTREVERLTKQVLDEVKVEPTCRRLMTVPGVGPLTALAFRATIDQPDRFRKSRDVGAHLGLTPRRYQSGETDVQGRISRCGDELARTALYEAAHSLLIRSTKWSALRAWGMNVAKRRGMARARVAVARKLAVILHRMWAAGREFRWGKQAAA